MLSVYEYLNPAQYIKDVWSEKKTKNPSFSVRSWARQLGLKAHNPLYEVISEKRAFPKRYVSLLITNLKMGPKEGLYFETLVDLQRAKSALEQEMYWSRLKSLSPHKSLQMSEVDCYKFLKNPLHALLIELTAVKGFRLNAEWIQSHICIKAKISEIEEAMERLLSLGFLKKKDGVLTREIANLTTKSDLKNEAVQEFHKAMSRLAAEQITEQDIHEREFQSHILNIEQKDIPKIKESIREFIQHLIGQFEAKSGTAENCYALNTHLFKLTKRRN